MAQTVAITAAGTSGTFTAGKASKLTLTAAGTWAGASVALQKKAGDGTYQTIYTFTADAHVTVDVGDDSVYRFVTTGTPTIKIDVSGDKAVVV